MERPPLGESAGRASQARDGTATPDTVASSPPAPVSRSAEMIDWPLSDWTSTAAPGSPSIGTVFTSPGASEIWLGPDASFCPVRPELTTVTSARSCPGL